MLEDLTFLEEGRFTKRDYPVRKIAEGVKSDAKILELSYWEAISRYIRKELELDKSKKDGEFRSRTASEILRSKHVNGCTDIALAFIVLARELGIPTKYVEVLGEGYLSSPTGKTLGHVFTDIKLDRWKVYEPIKGFAPNNSYAMQNGVKFTEVGTGLDFSEVYVREGEGYRSRPSNLQGIREVTEIFNLHIRKDPQLRTIEYFNSLIRH